MTIKDIARESGYAAATVSRVLNNRPNVSAAARKQVLAVVEKNNFRLNNNAKHLKQRSSESVAVIVKGAGNLLFAGVLEEVQSRIKAAGRAATVYYLDENDNEVDQAIRVVREFKPLGILFLGGDRHNFADRFGQVKRPCVLVSIQAGDLDFPNLSSVSTDDVSGGECAMEYLLKAGHRHVGVIGGQNCIPIPERGGSVSQLRLLGCVRACSRHGVPFDPEEQTARVRFSMEGGYDGAVKLLERHPEMTALFAASDVMAIGAIRAVRDLGLRVPEDVSVIGYDGFTLGQYMYPKLATIRQDQERMAQRSVELLLAHIERRGAPAVHEIVPYQFMPGESVRSLTAT